jgi:DNA-binding XRE family transcriptional regulator
MKPPTCTPDERERVRSALRLLAKRYRTQHDLGQALGVTQQTISAVLTDASNPGVFLAKQIARVLGMPLAKLLSEGWDEAEEVDSQAT